MTTKEFELIAILIKNFEFVYADKIWHNYMRERLANHFARYLAEVYPNFNAEKFIEACTNDT